MAAGSKTTMRHKTEQKPVKKSKQEVLTFRLSQTLVVLYSESCLLKEPMRQNLKCHGSFFNIRLPECIRTAVKQC